jgi:hypothetical protein
MAVSISIITTLVPLPVQVAHAAEPIETLATDYQPTISETIDASGFKHPGMGFTKEILDNLRTQVRAKKEPWNTYFNSMLWSGTASRTPSIKNVDGADPSKPRYYGLDSQGSNGLFIQDALTAYTQAILYYVTGDEVYRANAMRIIRLYGQMDPGRYVYFVDSHIHTGIPLSRMVAAAEILRYTGTQDPALAWTENDTVRFSNNLVIPVMQTFNSSNGRFMNQHLYTTIAKMSGAIFLGDRGHYDQAVEWFTVNKDAVDQGQNGAIKQLFRLVTRNDMTGEEVTPAVQHVEMGRDQAHGAGDITNAQILSRLMMSQGTKVDPVNGTPSNEPNAVGPYEFLGDRILAASELFGTYMLGNEIPWIPTASHTDPAGNPTVLYRRVSDAYRGRLTQNTWELFYYYQYVRGVNMEQAAPNFTRMYAKRTGYNWDGKDGGGDFWMFIPKEAEAEGSKYLVTPIVNPYREVEDRFTSLDSNSVAQSEGSTSFVKVTATPEGARLAVFGYAGGGPTIGFRIRTNGLATMDFYGRSVQLPDTEGQWRYVSVSTGLGDFLHLTLTGNGTTVDIDHVNIQSSTLLTPPAFKIGNEDLTVHTYAGSTLTTALDLSATDSGAGDVVTYQVNNLPQGASFDANTGAFSWKPAQAGTYAFVVEASDGTTITTKRVNIVVDADRQASVATVTASVKSDTLYVTSTQTAYNSVYADMMNTIATATDEVYFQKLAALKTAVSGLRELTPLLADGSINYRDLFYKSTFGDQVGQALDGTPESFVGYYLAQDRAYTLDFGPSFKVAANAFQIQSRASFPERMGGVTFFGSNDNENWTRLTPGETVVTEDMQTLEVQDDLRNNRYRFLKIHMIHPSSPLIEPGEFRIFGTRYETVNKLTAVSLASDQALKGRVVAGDTMKLSFQSSEPINNVTATIQGQPATITSTDQLNWTATAPINADTALGKVKFHLNYQTAEGVAAEPTLFTTDGSSLFIADHKNYLGNLLDITTVTDSSNRNVADALSTVKQLFDNNMGTATDYRVNGSGWGAWVAFDFRGGGTALLSRVDILSRQDQAGRINGVVVQGSNDYASWTTISNVAYATAEWQTLTINSTTPYRYIRIYNGNQWFGNMSELRLYGVTASTNKMASASISSAQALRKRIVPGNTVKLTFNAKEAISNVSATIQGTAASVATSDNINFTATATLPQGVEAGNVQFAIDYTTLDGQAGYPGTATTDGSSLYLVDEADTIKNVAAITTLTDSTPNRSAAATLGQVNNLFDSNLGSISDFRSTNGGWGSYIIFDFKSGNQVTLTGVELAPRQDQYYTRIKGTVIQGSNDKTNWTTLTPAAWSTQDWQTLPVTSLVPYRYLRIFNGNQWFGNMTEVRFHGSVHGADTTAPVTTADAPQGPASTDVTVNFAATDNQGGSGVAATYYSVNGGTQQTGKSVMLNASGSYTLNYWSVDWAGNSEQPRTAKVVVDKSVDVTASVTIARSGLTMNRFTSKYSGTVTITNTSGQSLSGPLQLHLQGLSAGVTLDNKTGEKDGVPYLALPVGSLAPGQAVTLTTTFSNPAKAGISYTPKLFSIQ